MACNVFGTPVTDATLKGMTEYHDKAIQAVDRARVALQMKNAEGKDTEARNFVDKIQANVEKKGVRCLIYNATGDPLNLAAAFEFAGCVSESPYATVLQNGQWTSFVHEKQDKVASSAALVFESTQDTPVQRQWVLGWKHTDDLESRCYAELHLGAVYAMGKGNSTDILPSIGASTFLHVAQDDGDVIFATIGNTNLPIYEAIMTKKNAMS